MWSSNIVTLWFHYHFNNFLSKVLLFFFVHFYALIEINLIDESDDKEGKGTSGTVLNRKKMFNTPSNKQYRFAQ